MEVSDLLRLSPALSLIKSVVQILTQSFLLPLQCKVKAYSVYQSLMKNNHAKFGAKRYSAQTSCHFGEQLLRYNISFLMASNGMSDDNGIRRGDYGFWEGIFTTMALISPMFNCTDSSILYAEDVSFRSDEPDLFLNTSRVHKVC